MSHVPPTRDDILASATASALPPDNDTADTRLRHHFQAMAHMNRVFAIRGGEKVVLLTDPLLDRRVVDAVSGIAAARGATVREFMAPTTQLTDYPPEAAALVEDADFVMATWYASVNAPLFLRLRKERGQRWVKITYFRNLDLLDTPQGRFPPELVGEITRANAALFPRGQAFDMRFSDPRGSDVTIRFTPEMVSNMLDTNRWRGSTLAEEPGCYVHYLPAHGPNIYDREAFRREKGAVAEMEGILYPQWAIGFRDPFAEKIGIEWKDTEVVKVHGRSREADVLREMITGARLTELGCGHNPKAPRFTAYPAGPNSAGALHWGVNYAKPSSYLRRTVPNWEEPPLHQDLATFDTTVKLGNVPLIDNGFLMALRAPRVVEAARRYGDPVDLLESFVE
ncbi:MAG: hypothetical protein GEU76_10050 [Alphaproteobacteria bacterium]|nr:hypothetical protein [Alphaproteobacteria bacterium]